jgi:RND superfamily putative drug exporter
MEEIGSEGMMRRLARLAQRRPKRMLAGAAVLFAAAGVAGAGVANHLDPYGADDPGTESVIAEKQLERAGYRATEVVVLVNGVDVGSSTGAQRVNSLSSQLQDDPDVAGVSGFLNTHSNAFVSRDGDATYLAVSLKSSDDDRNQKTAERIAQKFDDEPGVSVGGGALAQKQVNEQTESDLRTAELYAFPILFLLSLLFFRSQVAALLPLVIGGLAIVGTMAMLRGVAELGSISIFALNLVTGHGLGLAIDYRLFMVSRYREEIAKTGPGLTAMQRTMATAGRTVLFSSLTVAGALASLLVFPQRFLYSMGVGGSLVALIAAGIALLILPAILALLGERVNSLSPAFLRRRADADARPAHEGFWYRLSQLVMRFPARIAIATTALLLLLGIPFLQIHFTSVDAQVLPATASARQVDTALRSDFPPFHDSPITLALHDADRAKINAVVDDLEHTPGIASVDPPRRLENDTFAINAISKDAPLSDASQDTVNRIRSTIPGVLVGGFTAHYIDLQQSLADHLPLVLGIVVIVTFIVLFLMTGSVVLPIKQVLMNVLGLSATFGILVLVFQDGRFESLLGYTSQHGLESTQPLLLFAVAFGLSTDYGVFLLARIKEARDGGYDDHESVAVGLERTGRIVTAAALLFAVAIGAFVTSQIIFLKELGFGTAVAVLIDATIIRALLVPSLMRLLGKWNWWAPSPLRRLHERIGLSEA